MTQEQVRAFNNLTILHRNGTLSTGFLASHFGLSARHVRRLLRDGYTPKPRLGRTHISEEMKAYVSALKRERPELNCQWLSELASDHFETTLSRSSVYRILGEQHLLVGPTPQRMSRNRFEAESSGDVVQMDTTWGYWHRGRKLCLILLLDDYSRFILHGQFFSEDSAANNMRMIAETIERYGTFRILYTDNASFFKTIRHGKSRHQAHAREEYETEIGRACREVGITHLTHKPYQPQGKGKIERLFRFIQERFVSQIQDEWELDDMNGFFLEWMDWYNYSHVNRTTGETAQKRFQPEGFTPLLAEQHLEDVFCWKYTRKVDACNEFSFEGVRYTIPKEHCMVAFKVGLHVQPFSRIRVWHNEVYICEFHYRFADKYLPTI